MVEDVLRPIGPRCPREGWHPEGVSFSVDKVRERWSEGSVRVRLGREDGGAEIGR